MNFAPGTWISASKAVASLVLLLFFASCAALPERQSRGGIDHIVIVWLKRPGNADDKAKLVATSTDIAAHVTQVRRLTWGTAVPSTRPLVDDSFDLAFIMEFASRGDLEAYQDHPEHIRATKDVLRPLASRVMVYDIERD